MRAFKTVTIHLRSHNSSEKLCVSSLIWNAAGIHRIIKTGAPFQVPTNGIFFSEVKYRSLLSICFIQFTEFIPLYEGGGIIKIRISQFIRYITFMYKQKQRNNQATGTKWRSFCIILNQKRIEMVIYHFCTCKMKKAKCFLFLDWQQKNERKLKFHISSKSLNSIHLEFAVQAIIGRIKHRLTKPHYYATIYWPRWSCWSFPSDFFSFVACFPFGIVSAQSRAFRINNYYL